eukprot:IDg10071t1
MHTAARSGKIQTRTVLVWPVLRKNLRCGSCAPQGACGRVRLKHEGETCLLDGSEGEENDRHEGVAENA